jgi:hypothetical protein
MQLPTLVVQHPPGQLVESQTQAPEEQRWPVAQPKQTAPAVPHWVFDSESGRTQLPPTVEVQQPLQVDESQTHWPEPLQCCDAVQPAHNAPAVPHSPLVSDPYATHDPLSVAVQQPFAQLVESQTQRPKPLQRWPATQPPQIAPAVPH